MYKIIIYCCGAMNSKGQTINILTFLLHLTLFFFSTLCTTSVSLLVSQIAMNIIIFKYNFMLSHSNCSIWDKEYHFDKRLMALHTLPTEDMSSLRKIHTDIFSSLRCTSYLLRRHGIQRNYFDSSSLILIFSFQWTSSIFFLSSI